MSLQQTYVDHQDRLDDILEQLQVPVDWCGVVVVLGSKIASVDLFDRPATLTRLWPKLVRSYALDALEITLAAIVSKEEPLSTEEVRRWLHTAGQAHAETYASPGVGEDIRLEGKHLVGAGLVVAGEAIHVELFMPEKAE